MDMEDYDMFAVKEVPRLEDLAFDKSCQSVLGDLALCDSLHFRNTSCFHRHSSIISRLGLNTSDYVLRYVQSRIEELPGVVGEKFRERFLDRILDERTVGLRMSVLYDLLLFDSLTKLKVSLPASYNEDVKEFCDILVEKAPNLKSLEIDLPRVVDEETLRVVFLALTKFRDLENLIIQTDVALNNPEYYRILSSCPKLKQLRLERVLVNSECLANLVMKNPNRIFQIRKGGAKKIQKALHSMKVKNEDLTPVGRSVEDLYFEYDMPNGISSKLMANVLFNLPRLQTIYMDPTHVPEIFRHMDSALKKMHPIGLKKIRVEGGNLDTLIHISSVAPLVEAMELVEISRRKKHDLLFKNKKGDDELVFPKLHTLSLFQIDRKVQERVIPHFCPNLEVLSYACVPDDLRALQQLSKLKKLEVEPYTGIDKETEVPVDFFRSIESFKFTTGCTGPAFGQEIINRPGALKELDVQCVHDLKSDEDFNLFCRHGNWEVLKIRRCESLTLTRVFELLRFNPRLKALHLPKSIVPENPMTKTNAELTDVITKYCAERQIKLSVDFYNSYRCYFEPQSSGNVLNIQQFFTGLVSDSENYIDSDDGDEDDPNFFEMLQRAMVGDYDIDDIYGDFYDSDFSYDM